MADFFTEFDAPDTDLTRKAYDHAFAIETAAIAGHSIRTYLFGRALGEHRGLRPGADYDDEALFLACALHDAGLTEEGDGHARFEVDGADLAASFLREHGLAEDRVRLVWEAIALHTSGGIAHRMRPEIALTHLGAGADVAGFGADALPGGLADRAHAAYPRLGSSPELLHAIVGQIARDPRKAPLGSFPGELARQAGVELPEERFAEAALGAWPGVA
ncbi:HD domain-containing protein [Actinomadura sp. WMMB 499]|uniref:HD domain-containing protein n=1 Tax=Actinomadura sp. WMMB 499 TaxID=1219491 RepID=UPI001243A51F|nr:HD domain-containing protein [Actinomadura sp. WMMB 499]QFG25996.1 HD domain-containing protein [Actinomadura sp. WMMB 499]